MTKRKVKIIKWLLLLVAVVLLSLAFLQMLSALAHNSQTRRGFAQNPDELQFQQKVPLHEIDMSALSDALEGTWSLRQYGNPDNAYVYVKLPCDVVYYSRPSQDSEVMLVLEEGKTIRFQSEVLDYDSHPFMEYGLPDYDEDWRYARVLSYAIQYGYYSGNDIYYVEADSLLAVSEALYDIYKDDSRVIDFVSQNGMSEEEYIAHFPHTLDRMMFEAGVFVSPVYLETVLDTGAVLQIMAAVFLAAAFAALHYRDSKRKPKQ